MMRPVYNLKDINNFKITDDQKEYIRTNQFTKKELLAYLRKVKRDYYSKCTPIGYI